MKGADELNSLEHVINYCRMARATHIDHFLTRFGGHWRRADWQALCLLSVVQGDAFDGLVLVRAGDWMKDVVIDRERTVSLRWRSVIYDIKGTRDAVPAVGA
jgi:predicted choloylglycine hydrolase